VVVSAPVGAAGAILADIVNLLVKWEKTAP